MKLPSFHDDYVVDYVVNGEAHRIVLKIKSAQSGFIGSVVFGGVVFALKHASPGEVCPVLYGSGGLAFSLRHLGLAPEHQPVSTRSSAPVHLRSSLAAPASRRRRSLEPFSWAPSAA